MPDEVDPPRKFYGLKPKEFERVNPNRPGDAAPVFHPATPAAGTPTPSPDQPIDIHALHQQAAVPGPILNAGSKTPDLNDVHAVLRENLARENAAGLNKLSDLPPRKSRRARDYWLLMIVCNLTLGLLAANGLRTGNAVLFVYCMAGIGLLSAALTWVMWFVMDNY